MFEVGPRKTSMSQDGGFNEKQPKKSMSMFHKDEMNENEFTHDLKSCADKEEGKTTEFLNQSCVTKNDAELGELPVPAFEFNPMHEAMGNCALP